MKMINFNTALTLTLLVFTFSQGKAQTMDWSKQVITVNSGRFEFSPPLQDFVTAQSYNMVSQAVNEFNTIYTQSAQDILIVGHIAFISAQDSIIKFNLNTYQRMTAIADSGLAKLALYKNRLIVSKQYPLSRFFAEVLDTADLSVVAMVDNISGDCGGIAAIADTVYIAVNGGWMGTEGKIAVVDPTSWTLTREINLGAEAIGISNLYKYDGKLYSVNKTPYGMPTVGSISAYDPSTGSHFNKLINVKVGNGTGIMDSTLFVVMNEGIGSFILNTMQIADTAIVADPGSAMYTYILSSAVDTLNDRIYANIGDFMTPGICLVSSLAGDSITSYPTGISSDVIGIDYREYPQGIAILENQPVLTVYPNPVIDLIALQYKGNQRITATLITDAFGKVVFNREENLNEQGLQPISLTNLPSGLYCLILKTTGNPVTAKFIKQ